MGAAFNLVSVDARDNTGIFLGLARVPGAFGASPIGIFLGLARVPGLWSASLGIFWGVARRPGARPIGTGCRPPIWAPFRHRFWIALTRARLPTVPPAPAATPA